MTHVRLNALGSAYILGSSVDHLNHLYDRMSPRLDPWQDSPGEISKHDWREYLGDKRYVKAYVDFFEDELVNTGYDWKTLAAEYLFHGKNPLISSVVGGLAHPVIHLAYAYELSNRDIAMEALAMCAIEYNYMHKYIDDPIYTTPSPQPTSSMVEILQRVRRDTRFDGIFAERSFDTAPLLQEHETALLEHWNSWTITDPKVQFEDSQRAAVLLLVGTYTPGSRKFDFFLLHLLTSSHAVRILLPSIPPKFHIPFVREWWLFTLTTYIGQLRPPIVESTILDVDLKDRDWGSVEAMGQKGEDSHYIKAVRAIKEAATTWGDDNSWFLKAAARFAYECDGFTGFGPLSAEEQAHDRSSRAE
ncbi:MAG: hypothetical protein M1817_002473 [Caeruleum heppii]|nr:MAG: hypothetical protein M1817_002473 [Caeruleum heppii]